MKKIMAVAATVLLAISLTVTSIGSAEARHGRKAGLAVGGVALGILALDAMARDREYVREGCYRGPRECRWVRGGCWYDDDGARVCSRGHRECHRPVYCD